MSGAPAAQRPEPWTAHVITLVPAFWRAALGPETGLVGRAVARDLARVRPVDLRDFGVGRHRQVDDVPYGGGAGMVLTPGPLTACIASLRRGGASAVPLVALTPRGARMDQAMARSLAAGAGALLLCGRFEGVDERILRRADLEVSVGDLVLTGGDPAALCLVDAVVRLLPGVVGNPESLDHESFARGGLEHPHYTRPREFQGEAVPAVLTSGDHVAIAAWRARAGRALTQRRRPDLQPVSASAAVDEV